ncbi:MAG: response regulator [Oligoflexia bacterium]|nr:response regulator [Oligoflexia bacterium]
MVKILLAEDDPSIQKIARLALERIGGHTVTVCDNGDEAFNLAKGARFDLIVLDGMMPVMDGLETCQALKSHPPTSTIPIVFLTAKGQQSDIQEGLRAGAAGYIVKPFDPAKLCQEIESILENQRLQVPA